MSIDIRRKGRYELFETTAHHRILVLDGQDYFALVQGAYGSIIVKSDADHRKEKTLSDGDYVLFVAKNEPNWKDTLEHLELRQGQDFYRSYILPQGLPTDRDAQKKFVESREAIPAEKVPKK
ncbi:MAG TPA: hypothetical protein V6C52_08590 [Coleofasciculaceae cyanobacterium]|jgi:hypothetical protein